MDSLFPTAHEVEQALALEVAELAAEKGGTTCPACGQHAQQYRRTINRGMVIGLAKLYAAVGVNRPAHLPTVVGRASAEESKLAWWGLLISEDRVRQDGGRAGWWAVTVEGHEFLLGARTVPRFAVVYNGQLRRLEGDQIRVHDAYRAQFNLRELIGK